MKHNYRCDSVCGNEIIDGHFWPDGKVMLEMQRVRQYFYRYHRKTGETYYLPALKMTIDFNKGLSKEKHLADFSWCK